MKSVQWVAIGLLVASSGTFGCGAAEEAPADDGLVSWEEYLSSAYVEPDTGIYVVNGDEPVETIEQLRGYYDLYVEQFYAVDSDVATTSQPLIVNLVGVGRSKRDDKWSATQALNLTYCIQANDFSLDELTALQASLADAAGSWEAVANVDYSEVVGPDGTCATAGALFTVGSTSGAPYIARAFFPSSSDVSIVVDRSAFDAESLAPWTLTGVLTHELGHSLGFRHEHIRPEARSRNCSPENKSWRALTAYDSLSVMHYPYCGNGSQEGDLQISTSDAAGAAVLYPF